LPAPDLLKGEKKNIIIILIYFIVEEGGIQNSLIYFCNYKAKDTTSTEEYVDKIT